MTDTRAPHATCGGDLSVSKFGELTQKGEMTKMAVIESSYNAKIFDCVH